MKEICRRARPVFSAFIAFSPLLGIGALADETEVSDAGRVFVSSGVAFRTATESVDGYPLAVEPVYWLDASDTDSWEFSDDGGILKIPSKSGTSRYLTSKSDEIVYANYSQNLWYNAVTASKLKKPRLAPADNGLSGPYIDFGFSSSWKTLYFDPVTNGGVCAPSNTISGIGTIVGVYRSYNGGGNILGGSQFRRYTDYWGLRGMNFWEAVVAAGNNNDSIAAGTFWSGLQKSAPSSTFWSGGWQVIALNPVSADVVTHGLCGNCENHDEIYSSGDQGIAELMLFDRVLSDSDITNLIVHLEKKWLGRSPVGYNGNASIPWLEIGGAKPPHGANAANYPQDGVDVPVTVSSGDTLTVDRLTGGRSTAVRKHRVVKDGPGTLRLNEASSFGGTVNVREGTLAVGARPTPALSDLAPGLCLRFDPSERGSVTLEGDLVSAMENFGDSGKYSVRAVQENASLRPGFVTDAPASGLNMVDFGTGDASGGKCLGFETASAPHIGTLVLVVDSSTYTGAHFMNGMFPMRTTESVRYFVYDQWNLSKALFFTPNAVYINSKHASMSPLVHGCAWVNGRRVAHETEAYDVPGLNVVALRVPAARVSMLGGYSASMCGGMRIGEVLGWSSELSDEQIRDAQAYLMNKWLSRPAPGYAATEPTGVADLQEVVAEEGSRIHVPEGETATVAHLAASGTVYKTGSGTLRLQSSAETETRLVVNEGHVERAAPADVSDTCEIAASPTLHLDPSVGWSVRTKAYNGTNFVWTLMDARGLVCATEIMQDWNLAKRPFLSYGEDDFCNGLQTVNFGPMYCGYATEAGAYLKLSRNITNVRSVYLVLGSHEGGGNPLGCHSTAVTLGDGELGGRRLDFHRGYTSGDALKSRPLFEQACASVKTGELYVDGVLQENAAEYVPDGGYELVELHLPAGAQFNAIGNGFESYVHGGFRMGEMIVYERVLTERERVATRNHLLKKWFAKTDAELSALPERPEQDAIGYCLQSLVVDFSGGRADHPDAKIGFSQGVEVELRNIGNLTFGTMVQVMSAAGFAGTKNLETAVFGGELLPPNAKIKFRIADGILYARYAENLGLRVILR